jgi:hypothetical protein
MTDDEEEMEEELNFNPQLFDGKLFKVEKDETAMKK